MKPSPSWRTLKFLFSGNFFDSLPRVARVQSIQSEAFGKNAVLQPPPKKRVPITHFSSRWGAKEEKKNLSHP